MSNIFIIITFLQAVVAFYSQWINVFMVHFEKNLAQCFPDSEV